MPLRDCLEPKSPMAVMVCAGQVDLCLAEVTGYVGLRVAAVQIPEDENNLQ